MAAEDSKSAEERKAMGKSVRRSVPRSSHGSWSPVHDRFDPVELLEEQNEDRLEWLLPVRRERMSTSAFAFFRGSARIMAADLSTTLNTGLNVQLCGDAHLGNFGLYASPERKLVFDITDFDETLPGPWEWDIKRLTTSFTIAARHNGLSKKDIRKVTRRAARSYRKAMAEFSVMRVTDIWYAMLDADEYIESADAAGRKRQAEKITARAMTKDSHQALYKLAEEVDGQYRIKSAPPDLIPLRDLHKEHARSESDLAARADHEYDIYRKTVNAECRHLLTHFKPVDVALKVVGVGSVGTRCMIMLLQGRDRNDPLFLQLKEASKSVLEDFLSPGPYTNQGQRVVEGQRLMQAASDVFLGWTKGTKTNKDYYWRQLRDWKGGADVENLSRRDLGYLARVCGWTLARSHARAGDPVAIAGYLGKCSKFDAALVDFSEKYADQNERDYQRFLNKISNGHLESQN